MKRRAVLLATALMIVSVLTGCKGDDYKQAQALVDEGNYLEAITIYESLGEYKDSADLLADCKAKQEQIDNYAKAGELYDAGSYKEAIDLYKTLGDYEDSAERLTDATYQLAGQLESEGSYDEAIAIYKELDGYMQSAQNIENCCYAKAEQLITDKKYEEALKAVADYQSSKKGKHYADICNVHINGIEGLITYMKENIEPNSSGDYAKSVLTGKDNSENVLIYVENDVLQMEIKGKNHKSGDPLVDITLSGDKSGEFHLMYNTLRKVPASYAYNYGAYYMDGSYYAGTIINGYGKINFKKFTKATEPKFTKFEAQDSADQMDDAKREEFQKIAAAFMNPLGVFACEGMQQFLNEEDLRISIHELGMDKYELQFAADPYAI